ncbi:hypothetical protein ACFYY8_13475 [Streptosporangium sp. NPDC001559]|uniref:hypothetical protein n=1 Tax=Streptosporangium sp. NPDC001559 TaxID=3366187 RepID=UPI0036E9823A
MQTAHPDWLVFHSSRSGLWSAYRSALPGRPCPGDVLLVRAGSAEELDRKLAAQTLPAVPAVPAVPPSIQAVAVARALRARTIRASRAGQAVAPGRSTALRRLLRS